MQGQITKYRDDLGFGVIETDDGRRYRFAKHQIKNSAEVLIGQDVDFVLSASRPTDIIMMSGLALGGLRRPRRAGVRTMSAVLDRCDVPQVSAEVAGPADAGHDRRRAADWCCCAASRIASCAMSSTPSGTSSTARRRTRLRRCCASAAWSACLRTPRLQQLFLRRGLALLGPALEVAAEMRLNVQWGFNPVKFLRALEAKLDEVDDRSAARRLQRAAPARAERSWPWLTRPDPGVTRDGTPGAGLRYKSDPHFSLPLSAGPTAS